MEAKVDEIADGVYRISAYVPDIAPPAGFTYNHFLVLGDEPLLFHTGLRRMFPVVFAAVEKVLSVQKLRWICFGHYEADECGAMNEWLAAAPHAEVIHGQTGALVSLNDMADRTPRILADNEVVELGRESGSAISTRRTSRTDGTLACCTRRARGRCSAATFSPSSATGPP